MVGMWACVIFTGAGQPVKAALPTPTVSFAALYALCAVDGAVGLIAILAGWVTTESRTSAVGGLWPAAERVMRFPRTAPLQMSISLLAFFVVYSFWSLGLAMFTYDSPYPGPQPAGTPTAETDGRPARPYLCRGRIA